MNILSLILATTNAGNTDAGGSPWGMLPLILIMVVVFYFLFIRPQKKKQKEEKEMRGALEVGDGVTTIGGIVGRVVSIKDDTFLLETGSDRTRIRFQKFAIQNVEKLKLDE